jgi:hypothetical protein
MRFPDPHHRRQKSDTAHVPEAIKLRVDGLQVILPAVSNNARGGQDRIWRVCGEPQTWGCFADLTQGLPSLSS